MLCLDKLVFFTPPIQTWKIITVWGDLENAAPPLKACKSITVWGDLQNAARLPPVYCTRMTSISHLPNVCACRLCHKKLTEVSLVLFIYQMSVLAPSLSQTRVSGGGTACSCGDVGGWRGAPYCFKHAPDTSDHTGWGKQEVSWALYA